MFTPKEMIFVQFGEFCFGIRLRRRLPSILPYQIPIHLITTTIMTVIASLFLSVNCLSLVVVFVSVCLCSRVCFVSVGMSKMWDGMKTHLVLGLSVSTVQVLNAFLAYSRRANTIHFGPSFAVCAYVFY
jgi:hypothetical protein